MMGKATLECAALLQASGSVLCARVLDHPDVTKMQLFLLGMSFNPEIECTCK